MNTRSGRDQAVLWLGAGSLLSLVFLLPLRELKFLLMPEAGIAVAVVLGLLAIAGGWLGNKALTLAAGAGFLLAAVAQVVLQTVGSSLATRSNGSTFGLWLGLGAGLVALALTPQPVDASKGM
jgi:hypothetical protein